MILDGWHRSETEAARARNDLVAWIVGGLVWGMIVLWISGDAPYLVLGGALSFAMRRTLGLLFVFE